MPHAFNVPLEASSSGRPHHRRHASSRSAVELRLHAVTTSHFLMEHAMISPLRYMYSPHAFTGLATCTPRGEESKQGRVNPGDATRGKLARGCRPRPSSLPRALPVPLCSAGRTHYVSEVVIPVHVFFAHASTDPCASWAHRVALEGHGRRDFLRQIDPSLLTCATTLVSTRSR